jgi:hypothetical protein
MDQSPKLAIKHVARLAGAFVATVSRVTSHRDLSSERTVSTHNRVSPKVPNSLFSYSATSVDF